MRNFFAQTVAFRPVFVAARVKTFFGEFLHFVGNNQFLFFFLYFVKVQRKHPVELQRQFVHVATLGQLQHCPQHAYCKGHVKVVVYCVLETLLVLGKHFGRSLFAAVFVGDKLSAQFVVGNLRRVHAFPGEVYLLTVMHVEAEVAEHHRRKALVYKIGNRVGVAERLTHFAAVDKHKFAVHPVVDGFVSKPALRLRDFVFVVDGDVVNAARMDVKCVAEVLAAHCRALDVPARETHSPRTVPLLQVVGRSLFPQRKVDWMTFESVYFHACAVTLIFKVYTGQLAVFGKLFHRKVDAVFRFVGVAFVK